jgi:hypothetical protein
MALNASGPISLGGTTAGQSIALELGGGGVTAISLNDTNVRGLAGVASGQISMPLNFWGKSSDAFWVAYPTVSTTGVTFFGANSDGTRLHMGIHFVSTMGRYNLNLASGVAEDSYLTNMTNMNVSFKNNYDFTNNIDYLTVSSGSSKIVRKSWLVSYNSSGAVSQTRYNGAVAATAQQMNGMRYFEAQNVIFFIINTPTNYQTLAKATPSTLQPTAGLVYGNSGTSSFGSNPPVLTNKPVGNTYYLSAHASVGVSGVYPQHVFGHHSISISSWTSSALACWGSDQRLGTFTQVVSATNRWMVGTTGSGGSTPIKYAVMMKFSLDGSTKIFEKATMGPLNDSILTEQALLVDSGGNIYTMGQILYGTTYLFKSDTNGNLIWSRKFVITSSTTNNTAQTSAHETSSSIIFSARDFIVKYPKDGSKLGTFTLGARTLTITNETDPRRYVTPSSYYYATGALTCTPTSVAGFISDTLFTNATVSSGGATQFPVTNL